MPIRNQIEAVTQTLSTPVTFVYGTANELNQLADDSVFPVVFMYPLQPIGGIKWPANLERWRIDTGMVLPK